MVSPAFLLRLSFTWSIGLGRAAIIAVILLCYSLQVFSQRDKEKQRPNIIYILADDLGYGDLSCYSAASQISTPNIDSLAAAGIRFTNAHSASSVCTPSRYSILTGRYCWRSKMKMGVLWSYDWPLIEEDRATVADYLKDNGYVTAIVGKWHLGWRWPIKKGETIDTIKYGYRTVLQTRERERKIDFSAPIKGGPLDCGFDYQFGVDIPSLPPFAFIENGRITGKHSDSLSTVLNGYSAEGWTQEGMLPAVLNKSKAFITTHAGRAGKPFFLFLPLTAPHTPIYPAKKFKGQSKAGDYGDFVMQVDDLVGQIVRLVRQKGIEKNTVIFFASDNGGISAAGDLKLRGKEWAAFGAVTKLFNHDSNGGWKGMKGDIWEGGHRIPFIVSWPGMIPSGISCSQGVSLTDFFATCSGILKVPLPANAAGDSYDLFPLLGGDTAIQVRPYVIAHSSLGCFSIQKGNWKLITCNNSGGNLKNLYLKNNDSFATPGQLYDLKNDPHESVNQYTNHPEIVAELSSLLETEKNNTHK